MTNIKIGYARVSSPEQKLDLQIEMLQSAGAEKIYSEKQSGASTVNRVELKRCLEDLRKGDTLYVTKIDRLARTMIDLCQIVDGLMKRGVNIEFLQDNLRFRVGENNFMDMLQLNILSSFAQFERDLISERSRNGMALAKSRGTHLGRKGQDEKSIRKAVKMFNEREENKMSVSDIVKITGVPRATIYYKARQIN
jgi:DNA invertase Pin-like site-specific DNA recombinase